MKERFYCLTCGREIPPTVARCYRCASRTQNKFGDTFIDWDSQMEKKPISQDSIEYRKLEMDSVRMDNSGVQNFGRKWMEAYINNQIDMALIIKSKEQFMHWTNKLKEFQKEVVS